MNVSVCPKILFFGNTVKATPKGERKKKKKKLQERFLQPNVPIS